MARRFYVSSKPGKMRLKPGVLVFRTLSQARAALFNSPQVPREIVIDITETALTAQFFAESLKSSARTAHVRVSYKGQSV
jgi:hypothetical protein